MVKEMREKNMNQFKINQRNLEEFSRIQSYMLACDKDSDAYKLMKTRYIELKVILTDSGVNLSQLDMISQ